MPDTVLRLIYCETCCEMAIPDYQSVRLPLLRLDEDGQEHWAREAV